MSDFPERRGLISESSQNLWQSENILSGVTVILFSAIPGRHESGKQGSATRRTRWTGHKRSVEGKTLRGQLMNRWGRDVGATVNG